MHSDTPELVYHYQRYEALQTCLHKLVELSGNTGNLGKELRITVLSAPKLLINGYEPIEHP